MNVNFRRACAPALALLSLIPALSGCEAMSQRRKQQAIAAADSKKADEYDTNKLLDDDGAATKPQSFFKSSRLSGGLSSESREIEQHFGIQ